MMKFFLYSAMGIIAYSIISKSLKNKDSNLSKKATECAAKLCGILSKYTEGHSSEQEEDDDKSSRKGASSKKSTPTHASPELA